MIQPSDTQEIWVADQIEYKHVDLATIIQHEGKLKAAAGAAITRPIASTCNSSFHAVHNSGTRPLSVIDLIVMHATQGGTSRSVASYFTSQGSGGSTQLVVDDFDCYRCLRDDEIPWGAPGANYHGFHIEQCGYTSWLQSMWSRTHRKTLMRAAFKAALHCKRFGISRRFLTSADLKKGMRDGITTHAECTKAFGGDHTDPGTGWPRVLFMAMVKGYYVTLTVRKHV